MITDEDKRFKHLEKKIGIFLAAAIVGFLAILFFIGAEKDLFTPTYRLKFTTEKGTGFSRGMPVKLSGFRIGRISSIALNEKAMVDVEIQVGKKYQKWIKKDSVAKLVKEGMVGDNIIEVSVGSQQSDVLKDAAFIIFEKTKGLEEVANDIADKVTPVLIEVKEIISYINDPSGDIKQSMKSIRELTSELNSTKDNVDMLLVDSRQKIVTLSADAETLLKSADTKITAIGPVIDKVDRSMAAIEQRLPPLLDKAGSTLENLEKTSRSLEKISDKAVPKIPILLNGAEDALLKADTIMDSIKDIWLLRSSVPVTSEREFVPGDSHE
jgi:phospholipid/cholesterol/gamma-HCH transport system substrate-binding protein